MVFVCCALFLSLSLTLSLSPHWAFAMDYGKLFVLSRLSDFMFTLLACRLTLSKARSRERAVRQLFSHSHAGLRRVFVKPVTFHCVYPHPTFRFETSFGALQNNCVHCCTVRWWISSAAGRRYTKSVRMAAIYEEALVSICILSPSEGNGKVAK